VCPLVLVDAQAIRRQVAVFECVPSLNGQLQGKPLAALEPEVQEALDCSDCSACNHSLTLY